MIEQHSIPYTYRGLVLPESLRLALINYAVHGVPAGAFLCAVLSNDLMKSIGRADNVNVNLLPVIVSFVHNVLPGNCHGSARTYYSHIERKREERECPA